MPNELLLGKYDFKYFCKEILKQEFSEHHGLIAKVFQKSKRGVIVVPRGHGKTWMAIFKIIHIITYEPNKEIVLISSSREQSTKVLERIKAFIKEIDLLNFLKPQIGFHDLEEWETTWSRMEIATTTGCRVFVRPFNSSVRGLHVNYAFCDDVLRDDKNMLSDEKAKYIFFDVVSPIVNTKKGNLYVLGTPQTDTDLLAKLMKLEGYAKLKLTAVDDKWETPLWPSRFSIKELIRIREEIGAFAFTKEYLCSPVSGETSWFKEADIKAAISPKSLTNLRRENCAYYLGVDVAMSESETADYSVFTTIEYDYERGFYNIANITRKKGLSTKQHMEEMEELDATYDYDFMLIESNTIAQGVVREATDKWPNKCEGFHMGGKSKPEILGHLEAAFNKGVIKIPNNQQLIAELSRFRAYKKGDKYKIEGVGEHDDMVMSLAIAYENALENGHIVTVSHI